MSIKSALFFAVVSLWCLTGAASGIMAQQQTGHGTTTIVQMSYYALPGKEQDVLAFDCQLAMCSKETASPEVAC
jgi:hypothetical protein